MIWFTADLHFGHKNMVIHEARPPWIDRQMVYNWNKLVKDEEVVWVMGDFCWRDHDHWLPLLNGRIHLIKGSHDRPLSRYRRNGVITHKEPVHIHFMELGNVLLSHEPADTKLLNLCGHVHSLWKRWDNHMNVGVEIWNYRPVSLLQLERFMYPTQSGWGYTE